MRQETLIQILALFVLVVLSLFYSPIEADFEGKIIFFGIVILVVLFFVVFDIYNEIKNNKTRISLFDQKWNILERIKKLEDLNCIEDEK